MTIFLPPKNKSPVPQRHLCLLQNGGKSFMIRSDLYGRQTDTQSTRLLADVGQDAAVNVQNQAVDEIGSFRCQEDSGAA